MLSSAEVRVPCRNPGGMYGVPGICFEALGGECGPGVRGRGGPGRMGPAGRPVAPVGMAEGQAGGGLFCLAFFITAGYMDAFL